jgi:hypothetical protein
VDGTDTQGFITTEYSLLTPQDPNDLFGGPNKIYGTDASSSDGVKGANAMTWVVTFRTDYVPTSSVSESMALISMGDLRHDATGLTVGSDKPRGWQIGLYSRGSNYSGDFSKANDQKLYPGLICSEGTMGYCRVFATKTNNIGDKSELGDGDWHQLAVVFDPSSGTTLASGITFYIDGNVVPSNGLDFGGSGNIAIQHEFDISPVNFTIGGAWQTEYVNGSANDPSPVGAYRLFKGDLADVRVYSSALTAAEVECLCCDETNSDASDIKTGDCTGDIKADGCAACPE